MSAFHVHLVSDATGETVNTLAKAVFVLFDGVEVNQHEWSLVRDEVQLQDLIGGVQQD